MTWKYAQVKIATEPDGTPVYRICEVYDRGPEKTAMLAMAGPTDLESLRMAVRDIEHDGPDTTWFDAGTFTYVGGASGGMEYDWSPNKPTPKRAKP